MLWLLGYSFPSPEPKFLVPKLGSSHVADSFGHGRGQLNPTLRNLLPPDLMHQAAQLAHGLAVAAAIENHCKGKVAVELIFLRIVLSSFCYSDLAVLHVRFCSHCSLGSAAFFEGLECLDIHSPSPRLQ